MNKRKMLAYAGFVLFLLIGGTHSAFAQGTAFTYQGRLTNAGSPANGDYDLQFELFDTVTVGTGAQQGVTVTVSNVTLAGGVFSVQLDFGASVFSGAARFLEIAVKPVSGGTFTVLGPRQPIMSAPYAIQSASAAVAVAADSLSAACAGCVTSDQIQSLPPDSASYIQNTTGLQAASNFNVSGNGFIGGNLGIGTTAPQSKLAVQGSGYGFTQTDSGVTVASYISSGAGWLGTRSNHPLYFFTNNGSSQMTLDTSGNLGIGTTSPSRRLHVEGGLNQAIYAHSATAHAVWGESGNGDGVIGVSTSLNGVFGQSSSGIGVNGLSVSYIAVSGSSASGFGVYGSSGSNVGVYGSSDDYYAGFFSGKVRVTGVLEKPGGGFKIDHPLDPENKYLVHSFVESPDMKNLYDGTVTTDANGEAEITLPDWFAALNRDFRYQLTCIGAFAQAIIAEKIQGNRFKIKTSLPNVEVSWQVTGIRQDAWAQQNRLPVEEPKTAVERGSYQNPSAFGQPEEKSIEWARNPGRMKQQKEDPERRPREQNNKATVPAAQHNNR